MKAHVYYDYKWETGPVAPPNYPGGHTSTSIILESKCCMCGERDKNFYHFNEGFSSEIYNKVLNRKNKGIDYELDFLSYFTFPIYMCKKCGYVNFDLGKQIYGINQKKLNEKDFQKKLKIALENNYNDLASENQIYYTKYDLLIDLYEESNKIKFDAKNLFYLGALYLLLCKNYSKVLSIYFRSFPKYKIKYFLRKSLDYFNKYLNYRKDVRIEIVCIELMRRLNKYEQAKSKALEILSKLSSKSIIDEFNYYILKYQVQLCDEKDNYGYDISSALSYYDVEEQFEKKKIDNYVSSLFGKLHNISKHKTVYVEYKKYCCFNIKQRKMLKRIKSLHKREYPFYYYHK